MAAALNTKTSGKAKAKTEKETPAPVKRVRRAPAKEAATEVPDFLKAYIYPKSLVDSYIQRVLPGEVTDFDALAACYAVKKPVLLSGPTGAGKTMMVEAFTAKLGVPLFTIGGSAGVQESDLFGRYVPVIGADGTERLEWADGPVTLAARWGMPLYVDEGNFIPPEITSALHSATDSRRRIEVKGHAVEYIDPATGATRYQTEVIDCAPGFWVITAGNEGYNGTNAWNEAFKNRFEIICIDYDRVIESHLIASHALLDFAERLREDVRNGSLFTPVSTVRLIGFERNLYELGYDYAVFALLNYFDPEERHLVAAALEDGFSQRICEDYEIEFTLDTIEEDDTTADDEGDE